MFPMSESSKLSRRFIPRVPSAWVRRAVDSLRSSELVRNERGVYLALTAIISTVLIIALLLLVIATQLVKAAVEETKARADYVCKQVAYESVLQRQAADVFRVQLNRIQRLPLFTYNAYIESATLSIATMPVNSPSTTAFFSFDPAANFVSTNPPFAPAGCPLTAGAADFACFLNAPSNACDLEGDTNAGYGGTDCGKCHLGPNGTTDCKMRVAVEQNISGLFPSGMIDDFKDAGATVLCEITTKVKPIPLITRLVGEKSVTARVAWSRPPYGPAPTFVPPSPGTNLSPGLTIAVAPQVGTNAEDARFLFASSTYDAAFLQQYDPLAIPEKDGFSYNHPFVNYASGLPDTGPGCSSPPCFSEIPAPPASPYPGNTHTQREDMMVSCLNPVVMMRNAFLSVILELASRHGLLRNMTQVLMLNPRNEDLGAGEARSPSYSYPTKIVDIGQDLALRQFQSPAAFYKSKGTAVTAAPAWLNPFTDNLDVPRRQRDALLALQSRGCNHLYHTSTVVPPGVDRFQVAADPGNTNFEPPYYLYDPDLRAINAYANGNPWDQECGWSGVCASSASRPETAAEIGASLGALQKCPYAGAADPDWTGGACTKPDPCLGDLTPDIASFLFYAAQTETIDSYFGTPEFPLPSPAGQTFTGGYPAIKPPGIFPLTTDNVFPLGASNYEPSKESGSHILIVLHTPIPHDEVSHIRAIVSGELANRRITVVYMPASGISTRFEAYQDLSNAFNIPTNDLGEATDNALFIYSPYTPIFTDTFNDLDPKVNYTGYWHFMLTNANGPSTGPGADIIESAKMLFYSRILGQELRF